MIIMDTDIGFSYIDIINLVISGYLVSNFLINLQFNRGSKYIIEGLT